MGTGKYSFKALFHLTIIYIVWGSTYLAIRIAVREGGGWPPFYLGGTRVFVAAIVLLLYSFFKGERIKISQREAILLATSGFLMWVCGNGIVNWAEKDVDSGLTALIIGTGPIFIALMEAGLNRKPPTPRLIFALITGFAGLVVLTIPVLKMGVSGKLIAVLSILVSINAWNSGVLIQKRKPVNLAPTVSSGYQQLFASVGFLSIGFITGEPVPHPSTEAMLAWGYLVLFGSLIAFTSYITVIKLLPVQIASTTSYVNPVIAVFLGWLIINEEVTLWTILGTGLILMGVFGVFYDQRNR